MELFITRRNGTRKHGDKWDNSTYNFVSYSLTINNKKQDSHIKQEDRKELFDLVDKINEVLKPYVDKQSEELDRETSCQCRR